MVATTYITKDGINRLEAGEEANFVDSCQFVWDTWVLVLGSNDGVVRWEECES